MFAKTTTCIGLQAEQIFSIKIYIYIYIYSIVGVSFVASCNKKNWNNFCIIFAAL